MQYNWGDLLAKSQRVVSNLESAKQYNSAGKYIELVMRVMIKDGAHRDYIKAIADIAFKNKMFSVTVIGMAHLKNLNSSALASLGIAGW